MTATTTLENETTSSPLLHPWNVHKFGGTSMASATCIERCADIIESQLEMERNAHKRTSFTSDEVDAAAQDPSQSKSNIPHIAVVVSAMGGKPKVTDLLLSTVKSASQRDASSSTLTLSQILSKHSTAVSELGLPAPTAQRIISRVGQDINDITDVLKTVSLMKWQAERISELVSGYGELWSALILCEVLNERVKRRREAVEGEDGVSAFLEEHGNGAGVEWDDEFLYVDARRVITIDEEVGGICWDMSLEKLLKMYQNDPPSQDLVKKTMDGREIKYRRHLVITGYVASNTQGVATTLQRDGSDYSASIIGRLLSASSVNIWTDVDGVMSADPRRVPSAFCIPEVSFNEAMELAYFGAKVIHPKTMTPAMAAKIPIYIKNTFFPQNLGTKIFFASTTTSTEKRVCGFSSADDMALINLEGSGLMGVPGVANRLFHALERRGINVVLISQASSEHSITFATIASAAAEAHDALEEAFAKELRSGSIDGVDVTVPCSIIAAVGDGMKHVAGVAGRFFSALGDAKINVLAVAQGCSERNISAVVKTEDSTRALRAVHAAFRLSHTVVKIGIVLDETSPTPEDFDTKVKEEDKKLGWSLLELLEAQRGKCRNAFEIELQVAAVINVNSNGGSQLVTLKKSYDDSITPAEYRKALLNDSSSLATLIKPTNVADILSNFTQNLLSTEDMAAHTVIFDCTSNAQVSHCHPSWLRDGVHVITANSTGLSGPPSLRDEFASLEAKNGGAHPPNAGEYLREVTVGGAMPVITSLRDLLTSGDKIRRMDGILSVSMSYILYRLAPPRDWARCGDFDELVTNGMYKRDNALTFHKNISGENVTLRTAVEEAAALGLMEDNPLKDLNNEYTARCLMVLAKELGLDYSEEEDEWDVERIQRSMPSSPLSTVISSSQEVPLSTVTDYESVADQLDEALAKVVADAKERGCVPRHVASIDVATGEIRVGIVNVPENHVFATTPPGCECVRFFTERHRYYPLVIQGPSAGADSTASALLAELLRLMKTKVGVRSGALSRTGSSAFLA